MTETRRRFYVRMIAEQMQWIQTCDGDLDGYIRNYGAANSPHRSGNGGEAIYKADAAELERLERRLEQLGPARPLDPPPAPESEAGNEQR